MPWNSPIALLTSQQRNTRNATPCSVCSVTRRCATFDIRSSYGADSRFQICGKCLLDTLADLLRIDRTRNRYKTKTTAED